MHSTNKRCNTLQTVIGIFLHSCNAPESIMELLARMGVSIAANTVNNAVKNLSKEAQSGMQKLGQTFLASYAYNNLDIDLQHTVPTVEKPQDTLIHITSGTMLPLLHGVTLADLDCSDELWKLYHRNPEVQDLPSIPFYNLLDIYPEDPDNLGMTRRDRFNAWKYLSDLVNFGPQYFRSFQRKLGNPETVNTIPAEKTSQMPLRTVDVSPSTPAGNAEALKAFFQQTGVGDPSDDNKVKALQNHVILIFGDLLTGQHVHSLMESRSVEATPWRRMQFVVFMMGLFHLKMACADAIWRIFIHHKNCDVDANSLMAHVSQIRPRETGKIQSKPGFRRMHEVIQHVGLVACLDVWRIEVSKQDPGFATLDAFAESKPTWMDLQKIAYQIVQREAEFDISRVREHDNKTRDKQSENMHLRRRYFLLYEEMSYAMNFGDIGRVETLFVPWIYIFLGCGKHKYAAEMRRYLKNIHFVYPKRLRYFSKNI